MKRDLESDIDHYRFVYTLIPSWNFSLREPSLTIGDAASLLNISDADVKLECINNSDIRFIGYSSQTALLTPIDVFSIYLKVNRDSPYFVIFQEDKLFLDNLLDDFISLLDFQDNTSEVKIRYSDLIESIAHHFNQAFGHSLKSNVFFTIANEMIAAFIKIVLRINQLLSIFPEGNLWSN